MIQREDELINQRLSWLTTVQGILFAVLGFIWDKPNSHRLVFVFCFLGFFMSVIVLIVVTYATRAMWRQYDWWEKHKPKSYTGPDVMGFPPPNALARFMGPWSLIPVLFIIAWTAVLLIK